MYSAYGIVWHTREIPKTVTLRRVPPNKQHLVTHNSIFTHLGVADSIGPAWWHQNQWSVTCQVMFVSELIVQVSSDRQQVLSCADWVLMVTVTRPKDSTNRSSGNQNGHREWKLLTRPACGGQSSARMMQSYKMQKGLPRSKLYGANWEYWRSSGSKVV